MYNRKKTNGLFKSYDRSAINRAKANNARLKQRFASNRIRVPRPMVLKPDKKTLDTQFITGSPALVNPYVPDAVPNGIFQMQTTPSFQSVNLLQTGVANSMRVGNKVRLHSLKIQFNIDITNKANTGTASCRLMLIYDRQPAGTYPAIGDVLNTQTNDGTLQNPVGVDLVTAQINPNNFERFSVLMDKKYTTPANSNAFDSNITSNPCEEPWFVNQYVKLREMDTIYKATANPQTVAGFATGNLFLLCVGEYPFATTGWGFRGNTRLRYYDV